MKEKCKSQIYDEKRKSIVRQKRNTMKGGNMQLIFDLM